MLHFLVRSMAVGQKSSSSAGDYGQGFNYRVEFGFAPGFAPAKVELCLKEVLGRVDHRALGVDVDLGFEPTSVRLAAWLAQEVAAKAPELREVRLVRGDGLVVHVTAPE